MIAVTVGLEGRDGTAAVANTSSGNAPKPPTTLPGMSLTGVPLVCLLVALTVLLPVGLVVTWRKKPRGLVGGVLRFFVVLLCQVVAVATVGVVANRSYAFYNSWSELLGSRQQAEQAPTVNGLVPADGSLGTVISLSVAQGGDVQREVNRRLPVLVWLPPEYNQPQYRKTRFPVTMLFPGQPGTPEGTFSSFAFASAATAAIREQRVKPFVAVFPPIMVDPPRDTECTDIPGGPQAESWLWRDVRNSVIKHLRVTAEGSRWSTMGISTGGFCAAKLLLRHRDLFNAAVGFGAYYDSETDRSTGKLFGNSQALRNQNSPIWLVGQAHGEPTNLLIVVSRTDRDSYQGVFYADSRKMIAATAGIPGVETIVLQSGGHNYRTYAPTMPEALAWLGRTAGL